MDPLNIYKEKKPGFFHVLWVWFTYLIWACLIVTVIPAFIILAFCCAEEMKYDSKKKSATPDDGKEKKPLRQEDRANNFSSTDETIQTSREAELLIQNTEKAFHAAPIPVIPLAELIRTQRYSFSIKETSELLGVNKQNNNLADANPADETNTEQINPLSNDEENFFESLDSLFDVKDLKSPKNYYVTLRSVGYEPASDSDFRDLLAIDKNAPNLRFIAEKFATDFASIPLSSSTGSFSRAAVVHDWGYSYFPIRGYAGRKKCDKEMLNIMREDGTKPFHRSIIYVGLRLFGTLAFIKAPARRKNLEQILAMPAMHQQFITSLSNQFIYTSSKFESPQLGKLLPTGTTDQLRATFGVNSKLFMEILQSLDRTQLKNVQERSETENISFDESLHRYIAELKDDYFIRLQKEQAEIADTS